MSKSTVRKYLFVVGLLLIAAGLWFAFGSRIIGAREFGELTDTDRNQYLAFEQLVETNLVLIADGDEPGEELKLCLTFVDQTSGEKLTQVRVKFSHTSASGKYEPVDPEDESTARLSGWGDTDPDGRILVTTILPGDYGDSSENRHVHLHVESADPQAYDIFFLQYSTFMLRRFSSQSDQHFLADLGKTKDGEMVAFLTIECKMPN